MREVIEFACGTRAKVTTLSQSLTYEGLLEGYPNRDLNAGLLEAFVQSTEKLNRHKPYLVIPTETPKSSEIADEKKPWIELPRIKCQAYLFSRSFGEFGSSLAVCWFQDEFAFPIAPDVLEHLTGINWQSHAQPHDDF